MSEAPAALQRGRPVLVVTPPAVEQADMVWGLLSPEPSSRGDQEQPPGPPALIVCGDPSAAEEWADAVPPTLGRRLHPVTALERTARLLREGSTDLVAGAPEDLQDLVTRSALKLEPISMVVLAWPEWLLASGRGPALEQLMTQLREARRIVLAWNPASLEDFLERHARRPHVIGDLPIGEDARPLPPVGPARYAVVPRARRRAAWREVLDALDRPRVAEWHRGTEPETADAIICFDLPSRAELARISAHAMPVLLLSADQIPYARSVAEPLTALPLPAAWTRARSRADTLRAQAAGRIEAGGLEAELALLQPLLARYDAALVAAALLAIGYRPAAGAAFQPTAEPGPPTGPQAWVRLFVNIGRKDRVSPKDLVGALTRELGLAREAIGRIEVRESFSLVGVTPEVADRVVAGLSRVSIRGRRVSARRDREP